MKRASRLGIILLALGITIPGPALAAYAGWIGADLAFETVRWEIGSEQVRQSAPSLAGTFAWGPRTDARLGLRGSKASGTDARLAPGASAAVLVRHRPFPDWRFHCGFATPSGLKELDPASLALARRAAEPLLALPDPDPARGWRFHLSALWDHTPQRGIGLLLGAGVDVAAAFRATPEMELDPADAFSAQAALAWNGPRWRGRARFHAARESAERAGGMVVRGERTLAGLRVEGAFEAPGVRLGGVAGYARSGVCRTLNPEVYGYWLHPGPGSLGELSVAAEPRTALRVRAGILLRPVVEVGWRRMLPGGLPYADGWVTTTGARCTIGDGRREVALGLIWERGRWRAGEYDADPIVQDLRGWRFDLALRWRRGVPDAAGEAGE
jgi:hypothetical protein